MLASAPIDPTARDQSADHLMDFPVSAVLHRSAEDRIVGGAAQATRHD